MRKFNTVVMSVKEPEFESALWFKQKPDSVEGSTSGFSLWYFSEDGWKPLYDLDTRYNLSNVFSSKGVTGDPVNMEVSARPEVGLVDMKNNYSIYDGSRQIADNGNFVNEKGLKKHVDSLQGQIDVIVDTLKTMENSMLKLADSLESMSRSIDSIQAELSSIKQQLQ